MGSATTALVRARRTTVGSAGEASPGAGATKISKLRIVSLRMAWCVWSRSFWLLCRPPKTNPRKPGRFTRSFRRTMEEIGQPRAALVAAAALLVAALSCAWAWPFAIDDAWISVRYARHLASGSGYVWNVRGPSTDGVTPLPWAFLLAPLAHAGPMVVLTRAKVLGAIAWCVSATAWGVAVGRVKGPAWAKAGAIALLAIDVPVAAHAVSGMETRRSRPRWRRSRSWRGGGRVWRRCSRGWRRRCARSWWCGAVVVSVGFARARRAPSSKRARPRRGSLAPCLAAGPFAACALIRLAAFGRPGPLALLAKPSDLAHGLAYAGAAALVALASIVLASPVAAPSGARPGARHRSSQPSRTSPWRHRLRRRRLDALRAAHRPHRPLDASPRSCSRRHLTRARMAPDAAARVVARCRRSGALYLLPTNARTLRQAGEDRAHDVDRPSPGRSSGQPVVSPPSTSAGSPPFPAPGDHHRPPLASLTSEVAVLPGGHTSKARRRAVPPRPRPGHASSSIRTSLPTPGAAHGGRRHLASRALPRRCRRSTPRAQRRAHSRRTGYEPRALSSGADLRRDQAKGAAEQYVLL